MKATFITALVVALTCNFGFGAAYSVTDLGAGINPVDINNSGDIVCARWTYGPGPSDVDYRTLLYSEGTLTQLDLPWRAYPNAMNNLGEIVGQSELGAFVYRGDAAEIIPNATYAWDINDRGDIAGTVSDASSQRLFFYSNGAVTNWVDQGASVMEQSINNGGQIAGFSYIPTSNPGYAYLRPFVYDHGVVTRFGTGDASIVNVNGINDRGVIVGQYERNISDNWHAFIFQDGVMTDIGSPGGAWSFANAINSQGQIVGVDSEIGAFLYDHGRLLAIESLIDPAVVFPRSDYPYFEPVAINDNGQIIGNGPIDRDSASHGYLLTPVVVPEPSAFMLMATAVGGVTALGCEKCLRRRVFC